MAALYDRIGISYRTTRFADRRIVDRLEALLNCHAGATICDVGAGSGNYTNALGDRGYRVEAVEPSAIMRGQSIPHAGVRWQAGCAEALPLPDGAAQGVICTLASHHFRDLALALREMSRVTLAGPIVFFTFDPASEPRPWFDTYFPEIVAADRGVFLPAVEFADLGERVTGRIAMIERFMLPPDLQDRFMYAPWNCPEVYFDEEFRSNTSGFSKAEPSAVAAGLKRLEADLVSGVWDRQHGALRLAERYDAGFYFLCLTHCTPTTLT